MMTSLVSLDERDHAILLTLLEHSESSGRRSLLGHPKKRWLVSVARYESKGQGHDRGF
jgi:hypothetical protein